MSLTSEEMDFLQAVFEEFEQNPSLVNDWEHGFMQNNYERFEEFQEGTRLSPKQWSVIRDVAEKYGVGDAD